MTPKRTAVKSVNIARLFDKQAWAYIARSAIRYVDPGRWSCPCCGSDCYQIISRKSVVTALLRCQLCQLLYRAPRDPMLENAAFYQENYASGGLATTLPGKSELQRLLDTSFRYTDKNFSQKIAVLTKLGVPMGAKVLDFGSSWGYATWQMQRAGYDAVGFEVSRPRAEFGSENLRVEIATREQDLRGPFDAFFSSHVFEHLSNPLQGLRLARRLLRKDGVFVAFMPNGSEARLRANRKAYNHSWGRLHPAYLDELFYLSALPDVPKLLTSREYGGWSDLGDIIEWQRLEDSVSDLTRPELLLAFINKQCTDSACNFKS
jgi:SAM-dependent methyltransferase